MQDRRLVYSSDGGRQTPKRPAEKSERSGRHAASVFPEDGIVRISREKAHRGGKTVTVVRGLSLPAAELEALAGELKRFCGAGGTVREGAIEVQGDHRDRLADRLRALSHQVKLAGG